MNKRVTTYLGISTVILVMIFAAGRLTDPSFTGNAAPLSPTFPVQQGDLTISVLESGNLKALESVDIRSRVEGKTTLISIVPEGTLISHEDVRAGKVLIELDAAALKDNAIQQEIAVNNAKANYDQAIEDLSIQLKQNDSDVKGGELKRKFARMDLEKYIGDGLIAQLLGDAIPGYSVLMQHPALGGEALQSKRNLESDIDLAREEVTRAQNKLRWTQQLQEKGYVTRDELEADALSLKRKQVDLERAQTALSLFVKYDFAKATEKRLSDYQEAQKELERIIDRTTSQASKKRADMASKKLNHELQASKLKKLHEQIERCTIRATRPGLVIYAGSNNRWRRQEPIEEGATVRERQALIRLPDLSRMSVEVKVIESAVKKVFAGQKAIVTLDAFPDRTFPGVVQNVAPVPDSQAGWLNPDLKVYATTVLIDGHHPYLKPGLSAQVEIIIEKLTNVLYVPVQAVFFHEKDMVCYILADDRVRAIPVKTGAANDQFVVVTQGLAADMSVLLRQPSPEEIAGG